MAKVAAKKGENSSSITTRPPAPRGSYPHGKLHPRKDYLIPDTPSCESRQRERDAVGKFGIHFGDFDASDLIRREFKLIRR